GIFYYGGFAGPVEKIRLLGVLQRIALCYLFAGWLFVWLRPRGLAIACAGLLLGYWAMMLFIPVPGVGAGNFVEGKNLANYFDKMAEGFAGGDVKLFLDTALAQGTGEIFLTAVSLLSCFAFAGFLYSRKIFIRV